MTCWKTINLSKEYGFQRIAIISLMTMLFAFILFYLPLNLMYSTIHLNEDGILLFTISLFLIFPIHKVLHYLPLLLIGKKVVIKFNRLGYILPFVSIKSKCSLTKFLMYITLLTPFIFFTGMMLICCILFPQYIHYFTIIAAVNLGFCVSDFIFLKQIIHAPKYCVVEEIKDGYDILLHK